MSSFVLPRQWSQVVPLADKLFRDRRSFRVNPRRLPPGVAASVSQDGILIGDLFRSVRIRKDGLFLDGHAPTTQDQRQQARSLLSAFLQGAQRRPDAPAVVRFATQQHGALHHLTPRQLRSLRSSHRQLSGIGARQLHTHRALLEKKWPAPMLERMPLGTQLEVARNELDERQGVVLANAVFPLVVRRVYRLAALLEDRRFVWAFLSGQNEVEESFDKFVCLSRCGRIVHGTRKKPAFLCIGFWRSKRRGQPLATNVSLTMLFDEGSDRPVLREHDTPISPFHFNKLLEKVVGGGSLSFMRGASIIRLTIAG